MDPHRIPSAGKKHHFSVAQLVRNSLATILPNSRNFPTRIHLFPDPCRQNKLAGCLIHRRACMESPILSIGRGKGSAANAFTFLVMYIFCLSSLLFEAIMFMYTLWSFFFYLFLKIKFVSILLIFGKYSSCY